MRRWFTLLLVIVVLVTGCKSGPTAMDYLGDAQLAVDDRRYEEAKTFLELARQKGAPKREIQVIRSRIARHRALETLESGRDREAFDQFVRAADLDPRRRASCQTYLRAIEIGQRVGLQPSKLAPVAQKAVDADPSSTRARRIAGQLWEAVGSPKKAVDAYLWLWQSDKSFTDVGRRLAAVYQQLGQIDDAVTILQQVLEHAPDDAQAALKLAALHDRAGRPSQARELYEDLVDKHPDKPGVLLRYARFLKKHGHRRRAEELEERAYELLPGQRKRKMRDLR